MDALSVGFVVCRIYRYQNPVSMNYNELQAEQLYCQQVTTALNFKFRLVTWYWITDCTLACETPSQQTNPKWFNIRMKTNSYLNIELTQNRNHKLDSNIQYNNTQNRLLNVLKNNIIVSCIYLWMWNAII